MSKIRWACLLACLIFVLASCGSEEGEQSSGKLGTDVSGSTEEGHEGGDSIEDGIDIGNRALDFSMELMDGTTANLSDYRGKVVLLNFWATWCKPCVEEMPAFEWLKKDYGDKLEILAVNASKEDKATVEQFMQENSYTFTVALDGTYGDHYPLNHIPLSIIIDQNGIISYGAAGALGADTMYEIYQNEINMLLLD